jgi:8-oxo-dGTP pyrophosphatase MutT (NUDIX family)
VTRGKPSAPPSPIRQAGAIAFREGPRFLLVTARRDPRLWIFPKGHVEDGESDEEAALRELLEEGGVEGRPVAKVGTLDIDTGAETVRVEYYLVRAERETASSEDRKRRWCTYDEAILLIAFEETRRLLARARDLVPRGGTVAES